MALATLPGASDIILKIFQKLEICTIGSKGTKSTFW